MRFLALTAQSVQRQSDPLAPPRALNRDQARMRFLACTAQSVQRQSDPPAPPAP